MTKANRRLVSGALLLCVGIALAPCTARSGEVSLQLKNGDRLTGEALFEDEERIVVRTTWNVEVSVPKSEVEQMTAVIPAAQLKVPEPAAAATAAKTTPPKPADSKPSPSGSAARQPSLVAKAKPAPSAPPLAKKPKHWKWNLKLGTDFINGAKDREIYYGQTALTYTRNYERNPKQFLRNKIDYRVDYGKTDGSESVNRMLGANKLDFDVGSGLYGYAALGAGYDKVRKIEYEYELGPGIGYHLLAKKSMALDAELGLNYQYRKGLNGAPNREVIQSRIGQELTWEVVPKITLKEQAAFLPFLDDLGEYQVRLEGNLGFGIVKHLSLNLTVLNFYDTLPAPGVPNNEFQFRSSLGVNF